MDLEFKLDMARASSRRPNSSTPFETPVRLTLISGSSSGATKRSYATMNQKASNRTGALLPGIPSLRDLDAWLEDEVMGQNNVRRIEERHRAGTNPSGSYQNKGN